MERATIGAMGFVPDDFEPPGGLEHAAFTLRPLGPEHNDADFEAWMSSIDHIRATPGFEGWSWPHPMTLAENRADLIDHAADFAARIGFTYTVLGVRDGGRVIGCVYIYPGGGSELDAQVRSWVRADEAELDAVLYRAVSDWLETAWPFERIGYAARP
jgi:hypothetical protein